MRSRLILVSALLAVAAFCPLAQAQTLNTWTSHGPYGGAVATIVTDPLDSATIYVGSFGIFKGTRGAAPASWSWVPVGKANWPITVNAVVVDPTPSGTIFAGEQGEGVFRSVDGGETWTLANTGLTNTSVRSLEWHDPGGGVMSLYAGTRGGIFKSVNDGASWTLTAATTADVDAIIVDPSDPQVMYAVVWNWESGGLLKSTNGGGSWIHLRDDLFTGKPLEAIAVDPTSSGRRIYMVGASDLWTSEDAGANWTMDLNFGSSPGHAVAFAPDGTVFVGAGDGGGVFRRRPGETAWTPVNNGLAVRDVAVLTYDPRTGTLFAGTASCGGVYASLDRGDTWAKIDTGMTAAASQVFAVDPGTDASSSTLWVGTTSGVHRRRAGEAAWTPLHDGMLGGFITALVLHDGYLYAASGGGSGGLFKAPASGGVWTRIKAFGWPLGSLGGVAVLGLGGLPDIFAAGESGLFLSSHDGGATWSDFSSIWPGGAQPAGARIFGLTADPIQAGRFYVATSAGVVASSDSGQTWFWANDGLGSVSVTALLLTPSAPRAMYAATGGLPVFKRTENPDGSWTSWAAASEGLPPQAPMPQALAVDPHDPLTIYTTAGFVYRSSDGGASWKQVTSNGLPGSRAGMAALAIDPYDARVIHLGTHRAGVLSITRENRPPVANAGNNMTVNCPGYTVLLNGSMSTDPDGDRDSLRYTWMEGPTVLAYRQRSSSLTIVPSGGWHVYTLTVFDGEAESLPASVTVDGKYAISGTISGIDTLAPLHQVNITARLLPSGSAKGTNVLSTGPFTYRVCGLEPGSYRVSASSPDYIPTYYRDTWLQSQATPVSLPTAGGGNEATGVDFVMTKGGAIAGRVTSTDDAGGAISEMFVFAYPTAAGFSARTERTTADGTYAFQGLWPGTYQVATGGRGTGYAPMYFDGQPDAAHANLVTVAAAQPTGSVDFDLRWNTPAGAAVRAALNTAMSVTFASVSTAGKTTSVAMPPPAGGFPVWYQTPAGMGVVMQTSAIVQAPMDVCISVMGSSQANADFQWLRLLHDEGVPGAPAFVDRTILAPDAPAPDPVTKTLCARVDSLGTFAVTTLLDRDPPVFDPSLADLTADAAGPLGTLVSFAPTAVDEWTGPAPVSCSPASGTAFPVGMTGVTCTASDAARNRTVGTFNVNVRDRVAPVVTVPADMVVPAPYVSGGVVTFQASAQDDVSGALVPTCTPASGTVFPLGSTIVTCRATDASGNTGSLSFVVAVEVQIAGRVVFVGGATPVPVAGVQVVADRTTDGARITSVTDEDGDYVFRDVSPGTYLVWVNAQGTPCASMYYKRDGTGAPVGTFSRASAELVFIAGSRVNIDFRLASGYRVGGRVTEWIPPNGVGGPPVVGEVITWRHGWFDPSFQGTVTTDSNGRYLVDGLPPGDTTYWSTAPGAFVKTEWGSREVSDDNRNIILVRAFAVTGRAYEDANGNGAFDPGEGRAGIQVAVDMVDPYSGQPSFVNSAASGADGAYRVPGLHPHGAGGFRVRTVAGLDNHRPMFFPNTFDPREAVSVGRSWYSTADLTGIDFGVVLGAGIEGFVYLDANANGVYDAGDSAFYTDVEVSTVDTPPVMVAKVRSDVAYRLNGLPAGVPLLVRAGQSSDGVVRVYHDGAEVGTTDRAAAVPLTLAPGSTVSLTFGLRSGGTIAGRVLAAGGEDATRNNAVCVSATTPGFESIDGTCTPYLDAGGFFVLRGLPPTSYVVRAGGSASGYLAQFYSLADTTGTAIPVVVTPGGTTVGIDFLLRGNTQPDPSGRSVAVPLGTTAWEPGLAETSVTFSSVSAAGKTTVEPWGQEFQIPSNLYAYRPEMSFDVSTTAIVSGPITVCFTLASRETEATFRTARILHKEGTRWVDRTILPPDSPAPDFATRTLCARVDSLSPFLIVDLLHLTPPELSLPSPGPVVEATGPAGTVVEYAVSAADEVDPVTVECTPASGSRFPLGATAVTCTAVDGVRNATTGTFTVVVRDATAPIVTVTPPSAIELWPPNNKMVAVSFSGLAAELVGLDPAGGRFRVADEYGRVQPQGAVRVAPSGEWSFTVLLEASRNGNDRDGRRYTITVSISDTSRNVGTATMTAVVPHDSRR